MAFLDRSRHRLNEERELGTEGKRLATSPGAFVRTSLRSKTALDLRGSVGAIRQSDLIRREDSRFTYSRWFACGILRR